MLTSTLGVGRSAFAADSAASPRRSANIAASIVGLDWSFDNLGFLNDEFRQMLLYVVRSQTHGLISTSLVLKHADGRALALTSIDLCVAFRVKSNRPCQFQKCSSF